MIEYLTPIYLSASSRLAGDAKLKWLGVAMYPAPYMVLIYASTHNLWLCALSYIWVFGWKITGHQDGFKGLGRDNTLSPVAVWVSSFFNIKRDSKTYDALFWAIKGGLIALLPAAIMAFNGQYLLAVAIFLTSAIGYPLAYFLGFHVLHRKLFVNTVWGEALAGLFAGFGFLVWGMK